MIPREYERVKEATVTVTLPEPERITKNERVIHIEVAYPGEHVSETLWPERGDSYDIATQPPFMLIVRGTVRLTLDLTKAYWYSINECTVATTDAYVPLERRARNANVA